jgi:hypothetical protein
MRRKKDFMSSVIEETFEKIYRVSTPPASFRVLFREAPVNSEGKKEIDYSDHYISQDRLEQICKSQEIKYKLDAYENRTLRFNVFLGPSPRSIWKKDIDARKL